MDQTSDRSALETRARVLKLDIAEWREVVRKHERNLEAARSSLREAKAELDRIESRYFPA